MSFTSLEQVKDKLRDIASECVSKGPGYAQEGVVLREAGRSLKPSDLKEEQMVLEAWHCLFNDGELGWGYNLDNPGHPFFHAVTQLVSTAE